MGQGAFPYTPGLPLCLVGFHIFRRCSFSLVACTCLVPGSGDLASVVLVLSLLPDVSRKLIPVNGCTHSGRPRAHSDLDGSLSLCATSNVCGVPPLYDRNATLARVLVRSPFGVGFYGCACETGNIGGKHIKEGFARLCRLHGTSEISSHPIYLVAISGTR